MPVLVYVRETLLALNRADADKIEVDGAALAMVMGQTVSKAEALAFIFACTFNVPCVMALSTTYRESHSLKWTARVAGFYIGGALILSCIVYHIASLFFGAWRRTVSCM